MRAAQLRAGEETDESSEAILNRQDACVPCAHHEHRGFHVAIVANANWISIHQLLNRSRCSIKALSNNSVSDLAIAEHSDELCSLNDRNRTELCLRHPSRDISDRVGLKSALRTAADDVP